MLRWRKGFTGEPLLISVEAALAITREGSVSDEALAKLGNRIVRKELDKGAISYEDYRAWRKHNPLIFTTVVDGDGNMIGFFDIFPLTADAGAKIAMGKLSERTLTLDHIVPYTDTRSASHIHIATILVNPKQKTFTRMVAREVLIIRMKQFLDRHYSPASAKIFSAFAQSRAGETFLKRCGFSIELYPKENEQGLPLYVLRPSDSEIAISRLSAAERRFAGRHIRSTQLERLDLEIEAIELALRRWIGSVIREDISLLPSHVLQKIDERVKSAKRKNPAVERGRYGDVETRLELCDLREIQDTILAKTMWPLFEAAFGTKESVQSRFSTLADLRNGIRHSRLVDEVTQKDGEAAVIWFQRVLDLQVRS